MPSQTMPALVYENPRQMTLRDLPVPAIKPDEVLIRVAYSGICGSELSGYLGQNALRKPPLVFGHEFSGHIGQIGAQAAAQLPDLATGVAVTANPLISCGRCEYCLSGRQQLCPNRKLHSAHLPGSNASYIAVRADAVVPLPPDIPLTAAALTEPAACALRAASLAAPQPGESALVAGAGPIGLLAIQALQRHGVRTIHAADLNEERLRMAEALGAIPVKLDESFKSKVEIAIEAVGVDATREACIGAVRAGGRIVWIGLHEAASHLPVNDMIRREITSIGSFAYSPLEFRAALSALARHEFALQDGWTRIEPLERGGACFDELLGGVAVAKIWLRPAM